MSALLIVLLLLILVFSTPSRQPAEADKRCERHSSEQRTPRCCHNLPPSRNHSPARSSATADAKDEEQQYGRGPGHSQGKAAPVLQQSSSPSAADVGTFVFVVLCAVAVTETRVTLVAMIAFIWNSERTGAAATTTDLAVKTPAKCLSSWGAPGSRFFCDGCCCCCWGEFPLPSSRLLPWRSTPRCLSRTYRWGRCGDGGASTQAYSLFGSQRLERHGMKKRREKNKLHGWVPVSSLHP